MGKQIYHEWLHVQLFFDGSVPLYSQLILHTIYLLPHSHPSRFCLMFHLGDPSWPLQALLGQFLTQNFLPRLGGSASKKLIKVTI